MVPRRHGNPRPLDPIARAEAMLQLPPCRAGGTSEFLDNMHERCSEGEDGLICRAPTLTARASHTGMSNLVCCEEILRLKREYDRSLRVWAHYAFPLPGDLLELPGRLVQLKYDAQLERDIAAKRLSAHQGNCPVCSVRRSPLRSTRS
jgi:hypothetical protein